LGLLLAALSSATRQFAITRNQQKATPNPKPASQEEEPLGESRQVSNPAGEILERQNENFVVPNHERFVDPLEENDDPSDVRVNLGQSGCDQKAGHSVVADDAEEIRRIEMEWRRALQNGRADGDTPALVCELMPAIRAEAIRRAREQFIPPGYRDEQPVWQHFEDMIGEAVETIDLIQTLLNIPELNHRSEKSSSRKDRFGARKRIWRIWPSDAVENGAPEWRTKDGWEYPVSVDELEDSLCAYIARPWLAHPVLDWALLGGWLLGSAHKWRQDLHGRFLIHESDYSSFLNKKHKFGTIAATMMARVDAHDGAERIRRHQLKFNWMHTLVCVMVSVVLIYFEPSWWPIVVIVLVTWLILKNWIERRLNRARRELADLIELVSVSMKAIKAAWAATNSHAIELDDLSEKVKNAEAVGLKLSPGFRALLSVIRGRHDRVLAVSRF
jgi:hypothetical protein